MVDFRISMRDLRSEAVGAGKWAVARELLEQQLAESPGHSHLWLSLSPLPILNGDEEGYRNYCRQMLEQFSDSNHWQESLQIVKACTLLPDGVEVDKTVARPLEQVLDENQLQSRLDPIRMFAWGTRAMLEYRRGNTDLAYEYTQTAQQYFSPNFAKPYTLAVQAMVQHDLGQTAESKKSLEEASKAFDELIARPRTRANINSPLVALVLREATSKIYPEAPRWTSRSSTPQIHRKKMIPGQSKSNTKFDRNWWLSPTLRMTMSGERTFVKRSTHMTRGPWSKPPKPPEVQQQTPAMIAWLAGAFEPGESISIGR